MKIRLGSASRLFLRSWRQSPIVKSPSAICAYWDTNARTPTVFERGSSSFWSHEGWGITISLMFSLQSTLCTATCSTQNQFVGRILSEQERQYDCRSKAYS